MKFFKNYLYFLLLLGHFLFVGCVEENAQDFIDLRSERTSITIKERAVIAISLVDSNKHEIYSIENRDVVSARIEKDVLYLTGLQMGNTTVVLSGVDGAKMVIEVTVINMKSS